MPHPSSAIGHEAVLERMLAAHDDGALAHALLLAGPAGVGKTTVALALAATVLDAAHWPGGLLAHPDLWLEDSDAENVGIERIRAGARDGGGPSMQDVMSLRTYAGGLRVAVLARAERLTEPAADALLKTLEEPPPGTVIVLCAANPEALPATVLSRVQQVALATVPASRIVAWLTAAGIEPRLASLSASLAGGRPGRALRLATQPGVLSAEVEALHAFLAVAGGGMDGALRAATALTPSQPGAEGRERALLLLAVWSTFVRDAAFEAVAVSEGRVWDGYGEALQRWAAGLGAARITEILGLLLRASGEIAQYAQPRLTFETLFLDIFAGPYPPPAVEVPALPDGLAEAPAAVAPSPRSPRKATRRPARRG